MMKSLADSGTHSVYREEQMFTNQASTLLRYGGLRSVHPPVGSVPSRNESDGEGKKALLC